MKSKRLLALFFVLLLVIFSSCGKNAGGDNGPSLSSEQVTDTVNKIDGEITEATDFSEGLAFVCLNGDNNTTYCIDKKGNIIFEINAYCCSKFINGHVIADGGICDTEGNITYPDDVNVTTFYDVAFKGGFILAEKVTSDYSSSKKELGIMDFSYKWIVQPSVDLHTIIEDGWLYYSNNYVFNTDKKICVNLQTGALTQTNGELFAEETDFWRAESSNQNDCLSFYDLFGNQRLKIEDKNLNMPNAYLGFRFSNNHCVIGFYNEESDKSYLTLIDKTGKYLFDPVEFSERGIGKCYFDGKTILATDLYSNRNGIHDSLTKMKTYDTKGNLLGEMTVDKDDYYSCSLNDGVILTGHGLTGSKTYSYYTFDFQPLF